jgi:16S rRNA (cytosine967-C5)-methyltransferase
VSFSISRSSVGSFPSTRDRRWTREAVYGMLRQRALTDVIRGRVRGGLVRLDPDVIDLLRLGVYQLLQMGSVPAYAAIAQTVSSPSADTDSAPANW